MTMNTATMSEITNLINLAIRSKNEIRKTVTIAEADALAEAATAAMKKADELAGPYPRPNVVRQRMMYGNRVTAKAWAAAQERFANSGK